MDIGVGVGVRTGGIGRRDAEQAAEFADEELVVGAFAAVLVRPFADEVLSLVWVGNRGRCGNGLGGGTHSALICTWGAEVESKNLPPPAAVTMPTTVWGGRANPTTQARPEVVGMALPPDRRS